MPMERISFDQARELIAANTRQLPGRFLPLNELAGLVAAADAVATVNSPSLDCSRKEGFAVRGAELAGASAERPVRLRLAGLATAGGGQTVAVGPGQAVRLTTGAPLPPGADAVLADEFARCQGDEVLCLAVAEPGRNVMARGADVRPGQVLLAAGALIAPAGVGLLAAGGAAGALAHPRPRVAVLATGSEVVAPGLPLPGGGLYASNLAALGAWLRLLGMAGPLALAPDEPAELRRAALEALSGADALITSGGTGHGERDLVGAALADLGLRTVFAGVRLGPGKGAVFGLLEGKPVFCLPGGPPACEVAFLELALPALLALAGRHDDGLAEVTVRLADEARGQLGWTNVLMGVLEPADDLPLLRTLRGAGRLAEMAAARVLLRLPEHVERLPQGAVTRARRICPGFDGI